MSGATIPRRMGQAESTAKADNSALRLYDIYRKRRGKVPFAQMQYIEIEQDNFETEMFNYQNWISSSLIPCFFDDDLQPPRKRNQEEDAPTRILNASTLGKYVGKVINLIRHKFPHHPDYAGLKSDEVPAWWSRDRKSFETECSDSHRRMAGSEYFVGQMETRPLYSDNIFVGYDGVLESPINDYISIIDLQSILKQLFAAATLDCNKEGKLQQRSWIAECFHAVGRGGEVKFIDTADFMYHPWYEVLDTKWTETKTSVRSFQTMLPLDTLPTVSIVWARISQWREICFIPISRSSFLQGQWGIEENHSHNSRESAGGDAQKRLRIQVENIFICTSYI